MIIVWRIAGELLLKNVPEHPVNNLRHSALQTGRGDKTHTGEKEIKVLMHFKDSSGKKMRVFLACPRKGSSV